MSNKLDHIQYSPVWNYRYEQLFREVKYNGKELNTEEKSEFVKIVDETISDYLEGLPMLKHLLDSNKSKHDEYHDAYNVLLSVMQFVLITMADHLVITKYFILADKDYDRRFMRGKMKIILNEGFKKLYGFEEKSHNNSEWNKLAPILKYFPAIIRQQYQQLSSLLEKHSKSSSWWRVERNVETHIDSGKLYESRCEDIIDSKVMMESLKLFDTLFAVDCFLTNMHACFNNTLLDKYMRGELSEE